MRYRVAQRRAANRSGLTQVLGRMNVSTRHNLIALSLACVFWFALVHTGAYALGFFIPLLISSVLIPGVLTAVVRAPDSIRPWLGAIPSGVTAIWVLLFSRDEWSQLILQCIVGGAAVVVVLSLIIQVLRQRAA